MKINKIRSAEILTFKELDDIVTILGTTDQKFYPFLTEHGTDIFSYGASSDGTTGTPNDAALDVEYDPVPLVGGTFAYYFDSSEDNNISFADTAVWSFEADTAGSWGAWIMMTEVLGSVRTIWGKYLGAAEEYDFRIDTSGFPELELHDASASADETATSDDAITPFVWQFVVATYSGVAGASANAGIALYINGAAVSAITLSDNGTYVAMEDGAAIPMLGARNSLAAPEQEFEGYIALPFQTGTELTAANVASLHTIGQKLLGLA